MKSKQQKMSEANERNVARAKRTPVVQLRRLDQKLGAGIGAKKERARLLQQLQEVPNGMAQTSEGKRFPFPILFTDGYVRVYKNPTNEIFVECIRTHAKMRISAHAHPDGGLRFSTDGRVEPFPFNGGIGWKITQR